MGDHRDELVRIFQHEKYQIGFRMISVKFEKQDIRRGRETNISELCETVDSRPE